MSLTVSPELLSKARRGPVGDADFIACIQESLPYAWSLVSGLAERAATAEAGYEANEVPPPGEAERGQLLRLLASDAMRGAVERHFGMRLAFQNCHRVALFRPEADSAYTDFVTPRAQVLNQTPELVDC
ncbi:SCO5389 family protein [Streptomonospora sp. S1-112]|uniref:SCO5389 family protein n=1 Tax=Streptomonospora mangrovi TaxID=2883123 RepID=A0A9X3NRN1_9ACTN|nr:SCO5389 family protein [Streptomonospora mangrovi]MDA0567138.1 SCO5389 family protein [Streptomonospora mangrovi]